MIPSLEYVENRKPRLKQMTQTRIQSKENSFYIKISDNPIEFSQEVASAKEIIVVDFDDSYKVVGVEIVGCDTIEVEAES